MYTTKGIRCDVCAKVAEPKDADLFKPFVMPPNKTFPGIARAGSKKKLVQLHSCPTCTPKVKQATAQQDPSLLPPGPLRMVLESIRSQGRLKKGRPTMGGGA